jgi:hypothetical protein
MNYDRMSRVQLFADANGWRITPKGFTLADLARGTRSRRYYQHPLRFDHPIYFTADGRPVAIMAENYIGDRDALRAAAPEWTSLVLHEPGAQRRASLYNPYLGREEHGTTPQIVTRPDHRPIVWPTEAEMAETIYLHHRVHEQGRAAAA